MDKQVLAVMIPVLAIFFVGVNILARTILSGLRLRHGDTESKSLNSVHQHLVELQTEVEALRMELSETQERLDFAERLIAQERSGKLSAGGLS